MVRRKIPILRLIDKSRRHSPIKFDSLQKLNAINDLDVLYKAIHDWVPGGNVLDGRKAMIVVR